MTTRFLKVCSINTTLIQEEHKMRLFKDKKRLLRFKKKKHILKYLQIQRMPLHCSCYSYIADIIHRIYLRLRLQKVGIFTTNLSAWIIMIWTWVWWYFLLISNSKCTASHIIYSKICNYNTCLPFHVNST